MPAKRSIIEGQVAAGTDAKLASELFTAYEEAKVNFQLGGLRLSAVEGGRFCEAAFRILELLLHKSFTPLGKQLDTEKLIHQLQAATTLHDSVRMHIPRTLRVIYDIRNKRDTAHLADGIDPNFQDATLVICALDWILAEFIRLFHTVSANEAHQIVDTIVTRQVPIIQDFDGVPKVLNPKLSAGDYCLVLLYNRGPKGASLTEMKAWAKPAMLGNLLRTISELDGKAKIFTKAKTKEYFITHTGERDVEARGLLTPKA